ncbi:helix-turn-helix domain-containing protein [Agromyces ramosus]|uniref:DNA-binding CsgD family transcriptional regulator n=1 Tax=Agromyces ramosus TaxID=33879 RepID=A0ABU0RBF3_9MICO|nr:helix-turn-helix transcriptional regulator [Agromyces ramosus]MDQ0894354.1 DNA-binding CsgD family transcriptional regulator [Agromyces ramosus]
MSSEALDRGRAAFAAHQWLDAFAALSEADLDGRLEAADLEQLSTAALLLGRDTEGIDLATRAHEAFLEVDDAAGAARSAAWIGIYLTSKGDLARGGGWLARATRVAEGGAGAESAEGLARIPAALGALYGGDVAGAARAFAEAFAIGERFRDRDVMALAHLGLGQAEIMLGRADDGLALLDEVMVAVTAGEISPVASGIVYCEVIGSCHLAFDVRRAQEWTVALDHWCGARPGMVMFSGMCQAHRAELYRLHGAWTDALEAARVAVGLASHGDWNAEFSGWYLQGDVHRLCGEVGEAEAAYQRAAETGWPPQPGLALLRLAQGNVRLARSLIGPAAEQADLATRHQLLPAVVEIELAAGDVAAARRAADELAAATPPDAKPVRRAVAAGCDGAVRLAEGDARGALGPLRTAWTSWQEVDAPYEAARCRVLTACAWRALGDEASASMELDAARAAFLELGAAPDVLRVDALARAGSPARFGPLTPREVEVVRLVAEGRTNRAIAGQLYLSEKTVDRHLSNVFAKLGVSSRAAATAYAYEHALI